MTPEERKQIEQVNNCPKVYAYFVDKEFSGLGYEPRNSDCVLLVPNLLASQEEDEPQQEKNEKPLSNVDKDIARSKNEGSELP